MARPKIEDEFADRPVSRQRKYQLRNTATGLCEICGQPAELTRQGKPSKHCLAHAVYHREHTHKTRRYKRRRNSKTYVLERAAKVIHLDGGLGKATCGVDSPAIRLTDQVEAATCEQCFRLWNQLPPRKNNDQPINH